MYKHVKFKVWFFVWISAPCIWIKLEANEIIRLMTCTVYICVYQLVMRILNMHFHKSHGKKRLTNQICSRAHKWKKYRRIRCWMAQVLEPTLYTGTTSMSTMSKLVNNYCRHKFHQKSWKLWFKRDLRGTERGWPCSMHSFWSWNQYGITIYTLKSFHPWQIPFMHLQRHSHRRFLGGR